MSVAAETSACALCGGSIGVGDKECPNCHATAQWQDYARAVDFARKSFAEWVKRGIIREGNQKAIDQVLLARRQTIAAAVKEGRLFPTDTGLASPTACWRCGRPVAGFYSYCNTCGAPLGKGADTLRYLAFVSNEIARATALQLTLTQAHACTAVAVG
jgi:predicted amidophosphoribosyltransferase